MSRLYNKIKKLEDKKGGQTTKPVVLIDQEGKDGQTTKPVTLTDQEEKLSQPVLKQETEQAQKAETIATESYADTPDDPTDIDYLESVAARPRVVRQQRRSFSYLILGLLAGTFLIWALSYILSPTPVVVKPVVVKKETVSSEPAPVKKTPAQDYNRISPPPAQEIYAQVKPAKEKIPEKLVVDSALLSAKIIDPAPEKSKKSYEILAGYPIASTRLLIAADLKGKTRRELRIMRNEIYARHSYIFNTDEMKSYFAKQPWYSPKYRNVTPMLTEIEKTNIELIRKHRGK